MKIQSIIAKMWNLHLETFRQEPTKITLDFDTCEKLIQELHDSASFSPPEKSEVTLKKLWGMEVEVTNYTTLTTSITLR